MDFYLFLKSLHIFGVIIFLGNIIVTGIWKIFADYTKDFRIVAFSQRMVTYTDIIFTTSGVLILLIAGFMMAQTYGNFWQVRWIRWGLLLFIASGIIWVSILIPVQIQLHRLANNFKKIGYIPDEYWLYERIWFIFGTIAIILPLCNLYWMVFKPQ